MTRKQYELLEYVRRYIRQNGYSPAYYEMAKELGLASKSGVHRMIEGLVELRLVRRIKGAKRSISVVGDGPAAPADAVAERVLAAAIKNGNWLEDVDGPLVCITPTGLRNLIREAMA